MSTSVYYDGNNYININLSLDTDIFTLYCGYKNWDDQYYIKSESLCVADPTPWGIDKNYIYIGCKKYTTYSGSIQ